MNTSFFHHTPTIAVFDNREQSVRNIIYYRHPDTPDITAERITRHQYDARGTFSQSSDPRLFEAGLMNITTLADLSGKALRTIGSDAGTAVVLHDIAGRPCLTVNNIAAAEEGYGNKDQAITCVRQYEDASLPGRLLSVMEQVGSEAFRIAERFIYAGHADAEKSMNLAGQCTSHYDPAGLVQTRSIALSGPSLLVSRRMLKEADNPDCEANWQGQDASVWDNQLDTEAFSTQTTVNANGARVTSTDAKGNAQRVAYDVAGLFSGSYLTVKGGREQVIVKSMVYAATGQKLLEVHGNGVITTYTYEPETRRLTGIKTERPAGHAAGARVLQDLRYEYDPVGNVLSVHNDAEETRFWRNQKVVPENLYTYDSLYQLVSATGREMAGIGQQRSSLPVPIIPFPVDGSAFTNYTRTYRYDNAGNLTQMSHSAPASNNCYTTDMTISNTSNRGVLSSLTESPSEVDAFFTAGGQQLELLQGQKLSWTSRNQLLKVTPVVRENDASDQENYRYDGGSQRILKVSSQKTHNGTRIQRVVYLPGIELRTTLNENTEQERLLVMAAGEHGRAQVRVLCWEKGKPEEIDNNQLRWSYDNLVGSSALELDDSGNIISMEEYYPYGGTAIWTARSQTEADYKVIRYSGKEQDATGLYYYGYRYYQSWAGRWLSADPAGTADGLNLFRMCRNNPLTWCDPDGQDPITLLYGFEAFRMKYEEQNRGNGKPVVRIDQLNNALKLRDMFKKNYDLTITVLKNASPTLNDAQKKRYMIAASELQVNTGISTEEEAFSMIISWRSFLSEHAEELKFSSLIKIDKIKQSLESDPSGETAKAMICSFINKNMPGDVIPTKPEDSPVNKLLTLINGDNPDEKIGQLMQEEHTVFWTLVSAFFRKTSKLGLDWASQQKNCELVFIEGAFDDAALKNEALTFDETHWKEFGDKEAQLIQEKPYKGSKRTHSYFPITFSEMKHVKSANINAKLVSVKTLL
ncbi:RHS repeat protein [Enterobacter sp. CP102]|uniref:RHS repeat protein n=1 Tax=Enterobacter sp. CP102 TaxID=2976431 RepID=UPI0021FEE94B|nr:RHS repeat domain-containing protein [Enterobacter sp. CP102]UWM65337.1 RHS repeat protein [Enterobacter sp. CP102]